MFDFVNRSAAELVGQMRCLPTLNTPQREGRGGAGEGEEEVDEGQTVDGFGAVHCTVQ